jgi:sterol desaturase/sphingolipid hydroxylase (fatty acid hydroxylase superfamily)
MNNALNDPQLFTALFVLLVFILAYGLEFILGRTRASRRPLRDALFTLAGMSSHVVFSSALIAGAAAATASWLWPDSAGALAHIAFFPAFLTIFIVEEFLHYIIHRYAHEWRWLWKIHRTHHSGLDLNVGVIYRYNVFWVLLLPQTWIGAFAVYLGQGWAFATAVLITYCVNVATHSNFRWDLWLLQRCPWLTPFWRVFEKIITTPDAHHAHHAYGKTGHTNGNYAVTLFIFDVLLGTAKLPHSKQSNYGLPISERLHWAEELFWPLVKKPLAPKAKKAAADLVTE